MIPGHAIERFWSNVEQGSSPDECWTWHLSLTGTGYGQFCADKKKYAVHRLAYQLLVGPIPNGLQLDHLCRNRACLNPAHLEPVTNRENTLRGLHGRLVTHCPAGHPYDPANTSLHHGRRECRACQRRRQKTKHTAEYWRTYRARRRMAPPL